MSQSEIVVFYGLSTCPYCRRAKEFLEAHNVEFELHYVDQLAGEARDEVVRKVRELNPNISFPTILVQSGSKRDVIIGFSEEVAKDLAALLHF